MSELFIPTEASKAIDVGIKEIFDRIRTWDLDGYIIGMQKALNFALLMGDDRVEDGKMQIKQLQSTLRVAECLRLFKREMEAK